MKLHSAYSLTFRLWLGSAVSATLLAIIIGSIEMEGFIFFAIPLGLPVSLIISLPAALMLRLLLPVVKQNSRSNSSAFVRLMIAMLLIDVPYALLLATLFRHALVPVTGFALFEAGLFLCNTLSLITCSPRASSYFSDGKKVQGGLTVFRQFFQTNQKLNMETQAALPQKAKPNPIFLKGLITGGLILLMLIPSVFLRDLVKERQTAREQAVQEVSAKWAGAQIFTGPFLMVPYRDTININGTPTASPGYVVMIADRLKTNVVLTPEIRKRSIYNVLLYTSEISVSAKFKPVIPANINSANLDFSKTQICIAFSDYKGIYRDVYVNTPVGKLLMTAGVPGNDFGRAGLQAKLPLSQAQIENGFAVELSPGVKGSTRLQFLPLAGNATYQMRSSWKSPSFDGNILPAVRSVSSDGFDASWSFNRANLSVQSVFKSGNGPDISGAFGISLLQPGDQYDKTLRSIKYGILFIGLTFGLFFIVEIMQKKPFHPVQYVLAGLALTVFYSLLLSLSEFISFDPAYLIASAATVLLISSYAKAHFGNLRSGLIFFTILSALYGFIFVLIRLEETALLAGSIGLFCIVAAVMYASRKVDWYGNAKPSSLKPNYV